MSKPIIIVGYGGHASVLLEILIAQEREIIGYTDLNEHHNSFDLKYLGEDDVITDEYDTEKIELVLGLGSIDVSGIRKSLFEFFRSRGYQFTSVIHPTAIISPSVEVGEGTQIMAGVTLQTKVKVGANSIINTGAIIEHDCCIGEHTHIAPGSVLSGGVIIGDNCHIGVGTSIIQGITIGNESMTGAGSVVVKNVGDGKTVYGVPAKEV